MLILDSNTISYSFRGDPQFVPRLQALQAGDIGVPAIAVFELRYGSLRQPQEAAESRLAALTQFLRPVQVLPFDAECSAHAAGIRVALEAEATPIGPHARSSLSSRQTRSGLALSAHSICIVSCCRVSLTRSHHYLGSACHTLLKKLRWLILIVLTENPDRLWVAANPKSARPKDVWRQKPMCYL